MNGKTTPLSTARLVIPLTTVTEYAGKALELVRSKEIKSLVKKIIPIPKPGKNFKKPLKLSDLPADTPHTFISTETDCDAIWRGSLPADRSQITADHPSSYRKLNVHLLSIEVTVTLPSVLLINASNRSDANKEIVAKRVNSIAQTIHPFWIKDIAVRDVNLEQGPSTLNILWSEPSAEETLLRGL